MVYFVVFTVETLHMYGVKRTNSVRHLRGMCVWELLLSLLVEKGEIVKVYLESRKNPPPQTPLPSIFFLALSIHH